MQYYDSFWICSSTGRVDWGGHVWDGDYDTFPYINGSPKKGLRSSLICWIDLGLTTKYNTCISPLTPPPPCPPRAVAKYLHRPSPRAYVEVQHRNPTGSPCQSTSLPDRHSQRRPTPPLWPTGWRLWPDTCSALISPLNIKCERALILPGVAFSRFQTQFFQGCYRGLDSTLLSYGPCQVWFLVQTILVQVDEFIFQTHNLLNHLFCVHTNPFCPPVLPQTSRLGFCVQCHIKMETFKPVLCLVLDFGTMNSGTMCRAIRDAGRSFECGKVDALVAKCRDDKLSPPASAVVLSVVTKDKKQGRHVPLNTVDLLKSCWSTPDPCRCQMAIFEWISILSSNGDVKVSQFVWYSRNVEWF